MHQRLYACRRKFCVASLQSTHCKLPVAGSWLSVKESVVVWSIHPILKKEARRTQVAPKWHPVTFPSVVICMPLPWKMVLGFHSTSGLIMSHNLEDCRNYPNWGPNSQNWSHQYINPGIQPHAVRSSAYAAALNVPSE